MNIETVRKLAMSLPEVTEEPHHDYGSFRVRGKIFITMPPGGEFIHVFVPEQAREEALTVHSSFVQKLLWGGRVRGVRVQLADADPAVVKRLIREAWQYKAPKTLSAGGARR